MCLGLCIYLCVCVLVLRQIFMQHKQDTKSLYCADKDRGSWPHPYLSFISSRFTGKCCHTQHLRGSNFNQKKALVFSSTLFVFLVESSIIFLSYSLETIQQLFNFHPQKFSRIICAKWNHFLSAQWALCLKYFITKKPKPYT